MTRALSTITTAALVLGVTVAFGGFTTDAEAKVTQKWEFTNKDVCYKKKLIPATVEINTKGKLKHAAGRKWIEKGGKVIDKHSDAVYFTTKTVIEEQHVTLVRTSC